MTSCLRVVRQVREEEIAVDRGRPSHESARDLDLLPREVCETNVNMVDHPT